MSAPDENTPALRPYTMLRGEPGQERVTGTYRSRQAALEPLAYELSRMRPDALILGPKAVQIVRSDINAVQWSDGEVFIPGEHLEKWRIVVDLDLLGNDVEALRDAAFNDATLVAIVRMLSEGKPR